ncbi:hypothetical protein DAPPUDRAFT_260203 [Daphnia pulex]|uniref:Uncharacterized protein n=1 Tax=Daphnia pulex TaxID=6669 RepID=E9HIQ1_DAPPU|nr:hypothetical protein DAPPUDRAFT_260203 [Daphnia pulex]|eukprot:EFX68400.1 hypothetical protein DAPPUDRAFT_260203 [Daphnia pulex]
MQQQQQKIPGVNCNHSGGSTADPKRLARHSQTVRLSEEKTIKIAKNVAASEMHKMLTQAEYYPS